MGAQDVRKCSASFNPIHEEEKPSTYCGWLRKMLVPTRWSPSFAGRNRSLAVLLSHLIEVDADEATTEAISDWHYSLAVSIATVAAREHMRNVLLSQLWDVSKASPDVLCDVIAPHRDSVGRVENLPLLTSLDTYVRIE